MIDRLDQPENPRIRTKTNLLPPEIDEQYFGLICQFAEKQIDVETYLGQCVNLFHDIVLGDALAPLKQRAVAQGGQFEILRRHIDEKRYTVLFYNVEQNEVHAPHHHHNVASTQVLISGRLHLREYNRVKRDDEGRLLARCTSDRILQPGDTFQASEWKNNIHWFQAIEGPALIFNTNARGFETSTFENEADRFGRLYVDPTGEAVDGLITCPEFAEEQAYQLFGYKPLTDFPVR